MKKNIKILGFTLVELLVTITIFIIIIGAIYSAHTLSQRAYRESETAAEITQNGRVILERMVREIRQAKAIAMEFPEERAGSTSEIIFQDGHLPLTLDYIHYYKDDQNNVWRRVIAYCFSADGISCADPLVYVSWNAASKIEVILEQSKIIGQYASQMEFWGKKIINIALTLAKNGKILNLETKVSGRNL